MTKKSTEQDTLLEGVTETKEAPKATKKNGKDENVGYIANETLPENIDFTDPAINPMEGCQEKSIAIINQREQWAIDIGMAKTYLRSKALPKSLENAEQVLMAIQYGREIGLTPIRSLNALYFVNGKIALYGEEAIAQVIKAGHYIKWGKCNAETATITIIRGDNGLENSATLTMKEADDRGLHHDKNGKKKAMWIKYPENMLRFKVFHLCSRFHVSDALKGIGIVEELQGRGYVEGLNEPQEIEIESRPAEETAAPEGKLATPKAVKAFYLMANKAGWPEKEVKRAILQVTGKEEGDEVDLNNITETQLRDLIDMVEGA